jgi:hypothetical protein
MRIMTYKFWLTGMKWLEAGSMSAGMPKVCFHLGTSHLIYIIYDDPFKSLYKGSHYQHHVRLTPHYNLNKITSPMKELIWNITHQLSSIFFFFFSIPIPIFMTFFCLIWGEIVGQYTCRIWLFCIAFVFVHNWLLVYSSAFVFVGPTKVQSQQQKRYKHWQKMKGRNWMTASLILTLYPNHVHQNH